MWWAATSPRWAASRARTGRLNADGTLDTGFDPGASSYVNSLAVQVDGKIVVGGIFSTLGGQPRENLGRLNVNGTLDTDFNPGADRGVQSLAVQADGKILLGGSFHTLGGQPRERIGRLNADGSLDADFNPGADGTVSSLAVQADGKILAGGNFTALGGQPRNCIGRLNATDPATQSLTSDASTITWLRGGSSPEVWRTTFAHSPDGSAWTDLGAGTRIPGSWQLTGLSLPPGGTIRARGYVTGGRNNGSSWFVEARIGPPIPVLYAQPSSRINSVGTTASFSVYAFGNEPLGYQWYKDDVALADEPNLTGALTPTLTLSSVVESDEGGYRVVITNADGSVTSEVATLTVLDPYIGVQPVSQIVTAGESVTLSATAGGTEPLTYQWYKDGVALPQATEASHTLSSFQPSDAGVYTVVVTNLSGSATSAPALLTLHLPAALQGWSGGLDYSWGAAVGYTLGWQFQVNQDMSITTLGVHVLDVWSHHHQVGLWTDSGTLLASVTVTSTDPEYNQVRWAPLDTPLPLSAGQVYRIGANYPGPTDLFHYLASSVTMAPVVSYLHSANSADDGFRFPDNLSSADCGFCGPNFEFAITTGQPVLINQPSSRTNNVGTTASFSVYAGGSEPLSYQWYKGGVELADGPNMTGALTPTLTLSQVLTSDAGGYHVVVTNPQDSVSSAVAILTVTDWQELLHVTTSPWRYWDQGDQGTAWPAPGFDDSAWPAGLGLFGYESTPSVYPYPFNTFIPSTGSSPPGPTTVYYRTHFQWPYGTCGALLTATNFIDDGAVFYLNGVEVGRFNISADPVLFDTGPDGPIPGAIPEGQAQVLMFPTDSLLTGDNVMAVEVHQYGTTSTDDVFGMTLLGSPHAGICLTLLQDGSDVILNWTGGQGPYQVQRTATPAEPNSWQNADAPVPTNSMRIPLGPGHQFFRVRGQ
ncbi:MAG: immunoglobulin domain-containing protein [Verrucomicrobiales bacterium]|nr:immunoglobulin domain-containing protein [Verrucomicrobiales bacterium]